MEIVRLNGQPQPDPQPQEEPAEPTPSQPAPSAPQPSEPAPAPEPVAARGPVADPMGFIALATLHAEHAERCRVFCIESSAGLADLAAHRVAFGPAPALSRDQVVSLFRVLARQIRAFKDPSTLAECAGGPA